MRSGIWTINVSLCNTKKMTIELQDTWHGIWLLRISYFANLNHNCSSKILCWKNMNLASHHEMLLIPYVEDTLSPNNKSLVLVSNILAKTKYYITAKKTCLRFQNNNNNNNSYEILLPFFFFFFFSWEFNSYGGGFES